MEKVSEKAHVFIVEASAGSGKTYCLAKRYLELIFDRGLPPGGSPLRNILAITFTNKAMVEMKERILEFLKKIALDKFTSPQEKQDILNALNLSEKESPERARAILDELIRHYNFFSVQTIDSFINALLLGCALNIGRSASFGIRRGYADYIEYAFDKAVDETVSDKELLGIFTEFLRHYLFVEARTGWFTKENILEMLRGLFALTNCYGGEFAPYKGGSKDVLAAKKEIFAQLQDLQNHLPEGINGPFGGWLGRFLEKHDDFFDIANLSKLLAQDEPPMNKKKIAPAGFVKKWQALRRKITGLAELDATVAYNPYVRLFAQAQRYFEDFSRKDDVLFLEQLNRFARSLFGEEGLSVAEIYYRLSARYRHYLIDEFQDTSSLQWRNLELMVEDALSAGGTFFYVGDRKQAIYRFRGGEARLFDEVRRGYGRFGAQTSILDTNWRSRQEIVEFNNHIFSRDNLAATLAGDDFGLSAQARREILDTFGNAHQKVSFGKNGGYVRVERVDADSNQARNDFIRPKILEIVASARKRFSLGDIAFLCRDNNDVEAVSSWLIEAGIPVESEKTLDVRRNPHVAALVNLLKFLHSPIDDNSFALFILSDIFTNAAGLPREEAAGFLFGTNSRKAKELPEARLYRLFRKKYPALWGKFFDEFFRSVGFISNYELTVDIYAKFELGRLFPQSQGFFMKLLEVIKKQENDYPGLGDFLKFFESDFPEEDFFVNARLSEAVKVLTVHKAKGLEYNVVVIPFLRMDINPADGKMKSAYVDQAHAPDLGLLRITQAHCLFSETLAAKYEAAYARACVDELNNIYVALTRAKDEIYAFLPKKSANAANLARLFFPGANVELGKPVAGLKSEAKSDMAEYIKPSCYGNWIKLLREEFGDEGSLCRRQVILEGTVLHAIFSRITAPAKGKEKEAVARAINDAKILFPQIDDFSVYEKKALTLLKQPDLKPFFYTDKALVFCEYEVADKRGNLKRIDRLIVAEDAVLIDFKSSKDNFAAHVEQVKEYKEIVGEIYPGKKIKGYLVYFDSGEVEEIK